MIPADLLSKSAGPVPSRLYCDPVPKGVASEKSCERLDNFPSSSTDVLKPVLGLSLVISDTQ